MSTVAERTARKTFDNAAHCNEEEMLKLIVSSKGRHPILRALVLTVMRIHGLVAFEISMVDFLLNCLKYTGVPNLGLDRDIHLLGREQHVSNRGMVGDMIMSVVRMEVRHANLHDIPGNAFQLLWDAQKDLSEIQFCQLISSYIERFRFHGNSPRGRFWSTLEREYTREEAINLMRAGFRAAKRCFHTGVELEHCRCKQCELSSSWRVKDHFIEER